MTEHVCPSCKRVYDDEAKPLTTLSLSVKIRVAPGAVVLRSHVVDLVHEAMLSWLHEDTYESIQTGDETIDLVDIVIAR